MSGSLFNDGRACSCAMLCADGQKPDTSLVKWLPGLVFSTLAAFVLSSKPVAAQTAITNLNATYETGPASSISTTNANPCVAPYTNCGDPTTLNFGVGTTNNLRVTGFGAGAATYSLINLADRIEFRRVDGPGATGDRQLMFFETSGSGSTNLRSSYTNSMAEGILSQISNRGLDNAFSNDAGVASNNIERIDYIILGGLTVSAAVQGGAGFLILERGGNDPFKIAAITSLDAAGNPASFGNLISVNTSQWGPAGYSIETTVMRREENEAFFRPSHRVGSQNIEGVFISLADLGFSGGQTIYGYAIFPDDINSTNDLLGLSDFPTNTTGGGGLDLVAGGGIYLLDSIQTVSGRLYEDTNGDDSLTTGEAPLPNAIDVILYQDGNGNGTYELGEAIQTVTTAGGDGKYTFAGVADGTYRIFVDISDSDIPSNLSLGTPNDLEVIVSGANVTGLNFGFDAPRPNVLLIKRITQVNGNTLTAAGNNLAAYQDELTNPYDDNVVTITTVPTSPSSPPLDTDKWPDPTTFLLGLTNGGTVKPNDELEYTIYFLSAGGMGAQNVLLCDRVPSNVHFIPTAYSSGATAGAQLGIQLNLGGTITPLTGTQDNDAGFFFPVGVNPQSVFANVNCGGPNTNGAVVVQLGNLPNATAPSTPLGSYGFVRFKGKVK